MNCWRLTKSAEAEGRALAGNLVVRNLGEIVVGVALVGRFGDRLDFGVGPEDHNHSGELAFVFIEVFLFFDVDADAFAGDDAVSAGSPGLGIDEQRSDVGRRSSAR